LTPPSSKSKAEDYIRLACKLLKKYGYQTHSSCSVHVHLDASDFRSDPLKLGRVLRVFYAVEDILFSMNPESRWSNSYCKSLSSFYSFEDFEGEFTLEEFDAKWYKNINKTEVKRLKTNSSPDYKYCSLNLHSVAYRGTIEFRHHGSTLNAGKIIHWIALLTHLVEYAVGDKYDDKKIIELYSMDTGLDKLEKMREVFEIEKKSFDYITGRIKKFNSKFLQFKRTMSSVSASKRIDNKDLLERQVDNQKQTKKRHLRHFIGKQLGFMLKNTTDKVLHINTRRSSFGYEGMITPSSLDINSASEWVVTRS
ncbi:hypothetical protein LCGC14_2972720, partial [marine sediment metagenome]